MNVARSLRALASRPVVTVVAVLTLALGLGVNAAVFSLTREMLLRPLPYRDADGVDTALGRGFTEEDTRSGRDNVVLLTDGFWRRQFGASPVVGSSIDVDATPCTIIGVLPASFKIFRVLNRELDLFRPLVMDSTDHEQSLNVYAKLKPDVPVERARAEMSALYARLPIPNHVWSADLALAPVALRAVSGLLFGVGPFDPTILVLVSALLGGTAIAASMIPAVRAARFASVSFR